MASATWDERRRDVTAGASSTRSVRVGGSAVVFWRRCQFGGGVDLRWNWNLGIRSFSRGGCFDYDLGRRSRLGRVGGGLGDLTFAPFIFSCSLRQFPRSSSVNWFRPSVGQFGQSLSRHSPQYCTCGWLEGRESRALGARETSMGMLIINGEAVCISLSQTRSRYRTSPKTATRRR